MPQEIEATRSGAEGELIRRVARGEPEAVTTLFRTHGDAVFRFLLRRTAECYEDAQDLTQETFLAAFSLAGTFDGSCTLITWLCSLAKIRVAELMRRQGRGKRIPKSKLVHLDAGGSQALAGLRAGGISVDEVLVRLDAQVFLAGLKEQLLEDEREVLMLRYVEGFSVDETARIMDRSPKGVESLLTRAKRRCREAGERWFAEA